MKPSVRMIAALAVPVLAGSALALTASASGQDVTATGSTLNSGPSTVDVPITWHHGLLARPGTNDRLHVRVSGTTPAGKRVRFAHAHLRHGARDGGSIRLTVPKGKRRDFARATHIVVSTTQHYDSPSDANRTPDHAVVTLLQNLRGGSTTNALSGAHLRDCTNLVITRGTNATNCDLSGAHLNGMDLRRVRMGGASLEGADLSHANIASTTLAGADLRGTLLTGTAYAPTEQNSIALPTGGSQIIAAIDSATTSVDVVMYDFGGPNVVGQIGKEGALLRAAERGVNVRVILNSAGTNSLCAKLPDSTGACAWQTSKDFAYAMEYQLQQAAAIAHANGKTNTVRVQFSSENFNITHQKTVLIDAFDASGNLLPAPTKTAPWPATTQAIVSSGNLQAFPSFWGQRIVSWCPAGKMVPNTEQCGTWWRGEYNKSTPPAAITYPYLQSAVINEDYLTNPLLSCVNAAKTVPGAEADCGSEWSPRDFAIQVTTPDIIGRIAAVYASDARCDGPTVDNVFPAASTTGAGVIAPPGMMGSGQSSGAYLWPETWSNGSLMQTTNATTGATSWAYPDPTAGGYFTSGWPTMNIRGNVRDRQMALIQSAKKTLQVYNEEMGDTGIVQGLINAANSGVQVQIVMANSFMKTAQGQIVPDRSTTTGPLKWASAFDALAKAHVTIHLLDETGAFRPNDLYIHAKAIVADGTDGWVGSINASGPSMNDNRELGLGFSVRQDISDAAIPSVLSTSTMANVVTAFATDFASGVDWTLAQASTITRDTPTPVPPAPTVSSFGMQEACIPASAVAASGLPERTGPAPAPMQSPVTAG
ncbi:MAG: phospholipase D-like domain-containing protein [Thermoleophilia bacterium]